MPTINEFLGTDDYRTEADGGRNLRGSDLTANGGGLTTSGFSGRPSAINATGGTTFGVRAASAYHGFGPTIRKGGVQGEDYLPSGCSVSVDLGGYDSTSAGWVVSKISMRDISEADSYVKFTFGPLNVELHVTRYERRPLYTLIFTWPGGSYTREILSDNTRGTEIEIAMNGSKVGFWAITPIVLSFLAEFYFVTVPRSYVFSNFEMYSPWSGYGGRTTIEHQTQYWSTPVVAGGIRPLRKFQTLTGSPGGGRPLRKFQNGGHSGGRPLRKFATGI